MNEFEAIRRLERETWFQDLCHWYQDGLVEGNDGQTYRGRDVLDRPINMAWVKARMSAAKVENLNAGWILGILEEKFPRREDPAPISEPVLKAILRNEMSPDGVEPES